MTVSNKVCQAKDSILLVIDVQQRLVNAMPDKVVKRVITNTGRLLEAANLLDVPQLVTEQYPKGLGATHESLQQHIKTPTLEKTCFSACGANDFKTTLDVKQRKQVIIAGMESHVCVLQTALELCDTHKVFVVADACCARDKHHHHNAMARLAQAGVIVSNHESVLFEWLRNANHAQFKTVSALLR